MESWDALGLAKLPAIGRRTARSFADTVGGPAKSNPYHVSDKPSLSDRKLQAQHHSAGVLYDRVTRIVKDDNAVALLLGSMHKLLSEWDAASSTPQVRELVSIVELCVSINEHSLKWVGHVLASIVRNDRDRWMEPMTLDDSVKDVKDHLRGLAISPTELFPGGLELFQRVVEDKKASQEVVAAIAAPSKPPTSSNTAPKNNKKQAAKRSTSASLERPAFTTPAAPASDARRGGGDGNAHRNNSPPRRDPPQRYYGRGRGAGKRK